MYARPSSNWRVEPGGGVLEGVSDRVSIGLQGIDGYVFHMCLV